MIKIPIDKYHFDLLISLYPYLHSRNEDDRREAALLSRILKMQLLKPREGYEEIAYALDYLRLIDEPDFKGQLILKMREAKPSFIEKDKFPLWERSILAGLDGDWNLVVFMFIPLVERAIHNIAEQRSGEDLTELHKEIQKEPALGKDIEMLKGHMGEGARCELSLFLEKGSGENLRNKVAHGLATERDIYLWGPYLWWIALKVYFEKI